MIAKNWLEFLGVAELMCSRYRRENCSPYFAFPDKPVICASKAATAVRKLSGMTLV